MPLRNMSLAAAGAPLLQICASGKYLGAEKES
jgi:hypothetical protein